MAREELIPGTELRSSLQLPRRWPGGDTGAPIHFMSRRGALKHESSFVRVRSTSFAVVLSVHATSSSHVGCQFPADAKFETGFIDTRSSIHAVLSKLLLQLSVIGCLASGSVFQRFWVKRPLLFRCTLPLARAGYGGRSRASKARPGIAKRSWQPLGLIRLSACCESQQPS